jgi:hypothetical protein
MLSILALSVVLLGAASSQATDSPAIEPIDPAGTPAEFAARCIEAARAQRNRVRAGTDFWRNMGELETWWSARLEQSHADAQAQGALLEQARIEVAPYDRPGMRNMVVVGALLATCRESRAAIETGSED